MLPEMWFHPRLQHRSFIHTNHPHLPAISINNMSIYLNVPSHFQFALPQKSMTFFTKLKYCAKYPCRYHQGCHCCLALRLDKLADFFISNTATLFFPWEWSCANSSLVFGYVFLMWISNLETRAVLWRKQELRYLDFCLHEWIIFADGIYFMPLPLQPQTFSFHYITPSSRQKHSYSSFSS